MHVQRDLGETMKLDEPGAGSGTATLPDRNRAAVASIGGVYKRTHDPKLVRDSKHHYYQKTSGEGSYIMESFRHGWIVQFRRGGA